MQRLIRSDEDIHRAANAWCCDPKTAKAKYGPISDWIMYGVTNTSKLFRGKRNFNSDISRWNVANVTDMFFYVLWTVWSQQLQSAIGQLEYELSSVSNMGRMFYDASSFNHPLDSWNAVSVTLMNLMFCGPNSFNQPLGSWNVANVARMNSMFCEASSFNQPLNSTQQLKCGQCD